MTKQRIHPQNVQVRWGLGWIPSLRRPVKLYHAIINGHTLASFHSPDDAWDWIYERYEVLTHNEK